MLSGQTENTNLHVPIAAECCFRLTMPHTRVSIRIVLIPMLVTCQCRLFSCGICALRFRRSSSIIGRLQRRTIFACSAVFVVSCNVCCLIHSRACRARWASYDHLVSTHCHVHRSGIGGENVYVTRSNFVYPHCHVRFGTVVYTCGYVQWSIVGLEFRLAC